MCQSCRLYRKTECDISCPFPTFRVKHKQVWNSKYALTLNFKLTCCLYRAKVIRSFTSNTGSIFLCYFIDLYGSNKISIVKLVFLALPDFLSVTEPGNGWFWFPTNLTFHVGIFSK